MNSSEIKTDRLVLVVHGVGDPQPGETIGKFARSLALEDAPLEEQQRTIWLPEKTRNNDQVTTFPSHIRRLRFGAQKIEMAEVFWGDLSRIHKGIFGVIQGLFRILFGLRYVAYVAADQPGKPTAWLKQLGFISSRILHGPVLAVTFFLALLAVSVLGTQLLWNDSYKSQLWTQVIVAGCVSVSLIASGVGWKLTRSRVIERFWFWVNVTGMFVAGIMIVKALFLDSRIPELAFADGIRPGLIWYCRVLVVLLGFLWLMEIVVILAMAVCWFVSATLPTTYRPAIHIAFLLPALAVGVWGQAMPMAWLSAKNGIEKITELPEFSQLFDEAIPLLGVQFLMMIVVSTATGIVVSRYLRWRSKCQVADYLDQPTTPRLIVHGGLQLVLAACTMVGVGLVLTIGLTELFGQKQTEAGLRGGLGEINKYAVGLLVPLGGLFVFLLPRMRPVFDILLDVVNHFYFRSTNIQDALDDDDEFDINETTFESGSLFFCHRDAIHYRLKKILQYYRGRLSSRTDLVLVAHSQGTMIAIEVLNDPELAWIRNQFDTVTLITMGSPMKNLYQHYFRHHYPMLNQPFWSPLRQRVDRWVNIFRIDDYVGREIEFPAVHDIASFERGESERVEYCNHPVGPRGHQGYWTDREVLEHLRDHIANEHDAHGAEKRVA